MFSLVQTMSSQNFSSFLLWLCRDTEQLGCARSLVEPYSPWPWKSGYFFMLSHYWGLHSLTCLVAPQSQSGALNRSGENSSPAQRQNVPQVPTMFPRLLFFFPSFGGNDLICHSLPLPLLSPTSQFYPFLTHKHEKQHACSWKHSPQQGLPVWGKSGGEGMTSQLWNHVWKRSVE